ncbi:MAG TPA: septum formation initiator family protein [Patescibacteria group bacterium]|nr:septum formation initiator family protein [Patescibacteria group bacterium]
MHIKKIGFFVILIASLFVINSFIHSIYSLWQKNDLLVKAQQNLTREKQQQELLKKRLTEVNKPEFIEEEARNKLFLVKPGEQVVVLPDAVLSASAGGNKKHQDTRPNWKKWWELFTKTP